MMCCTTGPLSGVSTSMKAANWRVANTATPTLWTITVAGWEYVIPMEAPVSVSMAHIDLPMIDAPVTYLWILLLLPRCILARQAIAATVTIAVFALREGNRVSATIRCITGLRNAAAPSTMEENCWMRNIAAFLD